MKTVYSIGHSNKSIKEFVQKLQENDIDVLVDVRSIPYSKYNPQFNRESLRASLIAGKIRYGFRGANLGGKANNVNWDETIQELSDKCDDLRICVMCSEADPNNCHRKSKIEPSLNAIGVEVKHILWKEPKQEIHREEEKNPSLFEK